MTRTARPGSSTGTRGPMSLWRRAGRGRWRRERRMRPRADRTVCPDAGSVPCPPGSGWQAMLSAVLLSGAVAAAVAAATLRYGPDLDPGYGVEPPQHIAGVRLAELTVAYTTRAAAGGKSAEEIRAWGAALEAALDRVAKRNGAVLLPARAVAAGAPDLTRQVEAALAEILARTRDGRTGSSPGSGR
ncbi:MAG: hypothetical protein F4Y62_07835 [Rhodospirillaceae bacterium]|nr:hypothetical protein [Rhodospirillaceae bacterium]